MSSSPAADEQKPAVELPAGAPVFDEDGALSREFLLARGHCCNNGCRNCPYEDVNPGGMKAGKQS